MAYTLSTLQTELYSRGLTYLNDGGAGVTRVTRWINDAMHYVDDLEDWDYLYTTTTGTMPLTIADLGVVEAVMDTTNDLPLHKADRKQLAATVPDLALTGQSTHWYRTSPTVLAGYPVSTATVRVTYTKFGPDLSAAGDAPLMPDRFRRVVLELACEQAFRDRSNNEDANACVQSAERILNQMRRVLLVVPDYITLTGSSLDD